MFDLVTGRIERPFRDARPGTRMVSVVVHTLLLAAILVLPLLYATNQLPKVTEVVAFVVTAPPPAPAPPPPPPPPAPKARPAEPSPEPKPAQVASLMAAPVEAPSAVLPESVVPSPVDEGGVVGGVEGGVVGGVVGGIVGGLVGAPPPPPPPPPAPAPPSGPVRVGGQIKAPALVTRVDPRYPPVAIAAKLTGTVILELTVDTEGRVTDVKVLRSLGPLDQAAIDAVRQWRYSALMLNGIPTPFIVSVTVNFSLRRAPSILDVG